MDTLTKSKRSALMARIRGDNLGPETRLRKAVSAIGVCFLSNPRSLPGKPDLLFQKSDGCASLAVFVHGCFWHRCPAHGRKIPKTRAEHWKKHFAKNVQRDRRQRRQLNRMGYRTMVVWEHDLRTEQQAARAAERIRRAICSH